MRSRDCHQLALFDFRARIGQALLVLDRLLLEAVHALVQRGDFRSIIGNAAHQLMRKIDRDNTGRDRQRHRHPGHRAP